MSATFAVYRRWLRDRRLSTISWTIGLASVIVVTAAFYPSLTGSTEALADGGSEAMSTVLGLSAGIDPASPLGYLWIALYANILLIGAVTGRKGLATGGAAAIGIFGYVIYTLSNMTGSLDWLTWLAPWHWYVDDVMLINGLTWEVAIPFGTATVSLLVGWWAFLRRDLQSR